MLFILTAEAMTIPMLMPEKLMCWWSCSKQCVDCKRARYGGYKYKSWMQI